MLERAEEISFRAFDFFRRWCVGLCGIDLAVPMEFVSGEVEYSWGGVRAERIFGVHENEVLQRLAVLRDEIIDRNNGFDGGRGFGKCVGASAAFGGVDGDEDSAFEGAGDAAERCNAIDGERYFLAGGVGEEVVDDEQNGFELFDGVFEIFGVVEGMRRGGCGVWGVGAQAVEACAIAIDGGVSGQDDFGEGVAGCEVEDGAVGGGLACELGGEPGFCGAGDAGDRSDVAFGESFADEFGCGGAETVGCGGGVGWHGVGSEGWGFG